MMKRQNKKRGFTIIELTIVVAVIAILSAVLIPTFTGIIKKSRLSADEQAVRQMNTQLAMVADEDLSFADAVTALDKAGYNSVKNLTPVSKGLAFYWDTENKTIVLVNEDDNMKVVFPENYEAEYKADWKKFDNETITPNLANTDVTNVASLTDALANGATKVTLTKDLKLTNNVVVDHDVVIDLNGKKLNASRNDARPFVIDGNAKLTIDATGAEVNVGKFGLVNVLAGSEATVTLNGGTYVANEDSDNGAFLKVRDGATANITLNNVTYNDETGENFVMNTLGAENVTLTVNGGSYKATHGFQAHQATVSNATIITEGYAFFIEGVATESSITNCTITAGNVADNADLAHGAIVVANGAKVTADKCNITTNGVVAYFVCNSGGEIVATNTQGEATYGSTLPDIDAGATIKITVNGAEVVNETAA